jgi:hypothetical protein
MLGPMWEDLGWWHRMGWPRRKRQGLKLSGWLRKKQELRSRSPHRRLRRLCHWGQQSCLKLEWIHRWIG